MLFSTRLQPVARTAQSTIPTHRASASAPCHPASADGPPSAVPPAARPRRCSDPLARLSFPPAAQPGHPHGAVPVPGRTTRALRSRRAGRPGSGPCSRLSVLTENRPVRPSPLPPGEGRGEGKPAIHPDSLLTKSESVVEWVIEHLFYCELQGTPANSGRAHSGGGLLTRVLCAGGSQRPPQARRSKGELP